MIATPPRGHDRDLHDAHEVNTQEIATDQSSDAARKYHIWTIGCQMNIADSNHVAAELEKIGYGPTESLADADVVVLNTCVVRQTAEEKAMGKLGSLKPWKTERGPGNRPDGLHGGRKAQPAIDGQLPLGGRLHAPSEAAPLVNFLRQNEIDAEMAAIEREQLARRYQVQDELQPVGTVQSIKHLALSGPAPVAAHVPIVYGCSHACTFCIIPFRAASNAAAPVTEIVNEIRGLVAQGVREVTLLGQIVDRYGYDWRGELGNRTQCGLSIAWHGASNRDAYQEYDLADLLREVHEIEGLWRIRFLTSHPNYMTRPHS
jgi:tRNA-2-methylthio-N6-dimethylallyladenosine synthase